MEPNGNLVGNTSFLKRYYFSSHYMEKGIDGNVRFDIGDL